MLELEAELLSWRRKAEVDLRNEASRLFQHALILRQKNHFKNVSLNLQVSSMNQQLASLRDQNAELKADLEDAEARLKVQRSNLLTSSGSLPDVESQFRVRERRLRDELSLARRQRQEAEAVLLERDAAAVRMDCIHHMN